MGTDIFSWVEVLDPESNKWTAVRHMFPADDWDKQHHNIEFWSQPFRTRNYELFGLLAGVRGQQYDPIADPRGLPKDFDLAGACEVINEGSVEELLLNPNDALKRLQTEHRSHSYLFLRELLNFEETHTPWDREFLGEEFFGTLAMMKQFGDPERVRVVFCFD